MFSFKKVFQCFAKIFLFLWFPTIASAAWGPVPMEFPIDNSGYYVSSLASDANGRAIALYADYNPNAANTASAWLYENGTWTESVLLPSTVNIDSVSLAMAPNGTALALLHNIDTGEIRTFYFNNASWSNPSTDPLDFSPDSPPGMSVAMNGNGIGVAIWTKGGSIQSAFFSVDWVSFENLGPGDSAVSVAYSTAGTAIAGWQNGTNVEVRYFDGDIWTPVVVLDSTGSFDSLLAGPGNFRNVGIDATGVAFAAWLDSSGNVVASRLNGSWSPAQTLSSSGNNTGVSISVAPGGTAVVTWVDQLGNGQSNSFNGTSWGSQVQFTTDTIDPAGSPSVSVNDSGTALIVWGTTTNNIVSRFLPLGGPFGPQEIAGTSPIGDITNVISSLSANGTGFALWLADNPSGEEQALFANVTSEGPLPPESIAGATCKSQYALQKDLVNIITWTASPSLDVVRYIIRRDGVLIGQVRSTGRLVFFDHNRCSRTSYTYSVTAVNENDVESNSISIVLP